MNGDALLASGANVVFTIISDGHWKTLDDFTSSSKINLKSIDGYTVLESCILNPKHVRLTPWDPQSETISKGSAYEIKAKINHKGPVTWDDCRQLRESPGVQGLKQDLEVEVVVQPYEIYVLHKTPGLAVFDMDSTLIQQEVIDELARVVGKYDEVAAITESAMRGEIDFEQSLRLRVKALKGVDSNIWEKLKAEVIRWTCGTHLLLMALKNLGWKTAVLSGGFTPLAEWVKQELNLDYAFANQLALDDSGATLSGELVKNSPIIDGNAKKRLLLELAETNGIPTQNIIAVGDGSNDLPMMLAAGTGIAFNAKPKVQALAPVRLNSKDLNNVMYVLGYTREQADMARAAKQMRFPGDGQVS